MEQAAEMGAPTARRSMPPRTHPARSRPQASSPTRSSAPDRGSRTHPRPSRGHVGEWGSVVNLDLAQRPGVRVHLEHPGRRAPVVEVVTLGLLPSPREPTPRHNSSAGHANVRTCRTPRGRLTGDGRSAGRRRARRDSTPAVTWLAGCGAGSSSAWSREAGWVRAAGRGGRSGARHETVVARVDPGGAGTVASVVVAVGAGPLEHPGRGRLVVPGGVGLDPVVEPAQAGEVVGASGAGLGSALVLGVVVVGGDVVDVAAAGRSRAEREHAGAAESR